LEVKGAGSTGGMLSKPIHLSGIEESGISCVGMESGDIRRNAEIAKAAFWVSTDAEVRKLGEQTGLDTLVVHAVNDECSSLVCCKRIGSPANALNTPPGEYGRKTETQRN